MRFGHCGCGQCQCRGSDPGRPDFEACPEGADDRCVNCAVDDHAAIETEHSLCLGKCGALDGWIWRIWPRGKFFETLTVTALARRWQGHARLLVPLVNLLSGLRHLSCPLRFNRWMCGG